MPNPLRHVGLRAMILAYRVAGLTHIERLTLAAIASHADTAGRAWPGEGLLAAETSLGIRSVRKAVRGLEGLGFLAVARRGRQLPNEYAINVASLDNQPKVTGTPGKVTGTTCRSQDADRPASDDRVTGTRVQKVTGTTCRLTAAISERRKERQLHTPGVCPPSDLLSEYQQLFTAKLKQPPVIARGRDAKILGELVSSHGEEAVKGALARYLDSADPFVIEAGYSIPVFRARLAGLLIAKNGHGRHRVNDEWEGHQVGDVKW